MATTVINTDTYDQCTSPLVVWQSPHKQCSPGSIKSLILIKHLLLLNMRQKPHEHHVEQDLELSWSAAMKK